MELPLDGLVFGFFLLFTRVGAAIFMLPGFSDGSVNVRSRLMIALAITVVMAPALTPQLPELPDRIAPLISMMMAEFLMGILLGLAARLLMAAITVAGEMISFSIGFQAATLFDPSSGSNTLAPALFMTVAATVLIFATGLHGEMLRVIYDSYNAFPAGTWLPPGDIADAVTLTVQNVFVLGLQIAAPLMAVGFLGYMAFGIFNRLIPQLHAFFLALPINITVGLTVLSLIFGLIMTLFVDTLARHLVLFDLPTLP